MTATATLERLTKRRGGTMQMPRRQAPPSPVVLPMSRNDLPRLVRDLGFTRGAEIGVWKGAYSEKFCQASTELHMLCVDPWVSYPAWLDTKNTMAPADAERIMGEAYQEAVTRLTPFRCTLRREFSAAAAPSVPDGSLDFVYVDGNHVFDAVLEDLTLWAPKVRAGGFVAGHDYRRFTNKPTIHVIEAVQAYTTTHRIQPWFVLGGDRTPSFLWVVP